MKLHNNYQTTKAVDQGRMCNGFWGVDVAPHFGPGAAEVKDCRAFFAVDGHLEADDRAVVHEILGAKHAPSGLALSLAAKVL